jgi:pimeloyl-ACP methyl ester carboxylesterase
LNASATARNPWAAAARLCAAHCAPKEKTSVPRIVINDCNVEFVEQGSGEPVVLLHSTGASSAQWRVLIDTLSARFHVIAPDFFGYGATAPWPGQGAFSLADEAALVHTLLDRLDEPAHLVGHSYGGAVALHVARARGEELRSLTLIEPVAFHLLRDGDEADMAALREIVEIADTVKVSLGCGDYLGGLGRFIDYWSGPGTWASIRMSKRIGMATSLAKVALDFHATINDASQLSDFETMAIPTLLMRGSCTALPTQRICNRLAGALPEASTRTIRGAGHMSPLTHRDEVNNLIVAHLDANRAERLSFGASLVA